MFDWTEYLAIAKSLAEGNPAARSGYGAEAAIRSAISRAYYAAFGSARNHAMLRLSFTPTGTGGDHSALRRHLIGNNRRQLAETLSRLQQLRERCDYDDSELTNGPQMAQDAIRQAQSVLNQCS